MQITRQADYALRAVMEIATKQSDERVTTADIAEYQEIPEPFLCKIIGKLSVAGILQTTRGARGGVMLARSLDEVSLLDIVEAIDGPIMLNFCVLNPDKCKFGDSCLIRDVWCVTQKELVTKLRNATLSQFIPA